MSITVKAHTSIIGETGYNCHSRNFFKALNKLTQVQVRNFTVPHGWAGYTSDEPFNSEYYMDDDLKTILVEQSLYTENGIQSFPLYTNYKNDGEPDVHIVLNENYHHYFFDKYDGKKIAYNVWETTRYQDDFFQRLDTFDQVWVPSKWQRNCLIEQGMFPSKVKVVPEGVDTTTYRPKNTVISKPSNRPFRFLLVGRWDYRKSTKEIIETFIKTFSEDENVELLVNIDNPFAYDGMNSTEERFDRYGLNHPKVKILHHLSKEQYIDTLQSSDVFVSCARGEGWNLPLIEAMATGVPSIYTNWGAQLEFAEGRGIPVDIIGEVPADVSGDDIYFAWVKNAAGNFAEPNFEDLSNKMRDSFENFLIHKRKALSDSEEIRKIFTWENAAITAKNILDEFIDSQKNDSDFVTIVLSHADTQRRKELLKDCVSSLEGEIIVSANYPLDSEIQSNVDWVIHSKENPILVKDDYQKYGVNYVHWYTDQNGEKQYKTFEYEHGYAAYELTRAGLAWAKTLGKKYVHVINYDYLISKSTLQEHKRLLEDKDIILYTNDEWDLKEKTYCSAFFSAKLEVAESFFNKYKTKKEYYESISGFNILELNMTRHFNSNSYDMEVNPINTLRVNNRVNLESADNMYNNKSSNTRVEQEMENNINLNFVGQPFVEIVGNNKKDYTVNFIDSDANSIVFSSKISNNHWVKCNRNWFTNWKIQIESSGGSVFTHEFDLTGKRVFIVFESSSLGDNIAWIPYVEEFRKKHNCHVIVSTFHNQLFESEYPELEFVKPGSSVHNLYAMYRVGVFYDDNGIDFNRHRRDFTKLSLQEIACDILGLEYTEILPRIKKTQATKSEKPYICIANHSTAQSKYWNNPTGWQELVDYVKSLGYDVYLLSREEDGYMGNKNPHGVIKIDNKSLEEIGSILLGSEGFVGLGSGLSWYAWALGIPTILISGFSEPYQEMTNGVYRIINKDVCTGCFARHLFDRGDWNWCPDHKNTERQFECSKSITFDMVKPYLNKILTV